MARYTAGVGRDGKSNAFARKGERTLAVHHDPNNARQHDKPGGPAHLLGHRGHPLGTVVNGKTVRAPGALDIQPRVGKPKAMHPVAPHSGMHPRAIAGAGIGGQGHATATIDDGGQTVVSSAAAAPLAHAYGGGIPKAAFAPVQAVPGHRRRATDALAGGGVGENHARGKAHDAALGAAILASAIKT
jgi:hypothetical protein